MLGATPKAADHVIESLRHKGWLERASWGAYLLIPAEHGPDALGYGNHLALASRIADPYYIGFGTAAAHYGLTNVDFAIRDPPYQRRLWEDASVKLRSLPLGVLVEHLAAPGRSPPDDQAVRLG
jgi:hypothetical protein